MNVAAGRPLLRAKSPLVLVTAVSVAAAGCGGGKGGGGAPIEFTPAAMRSVPSVTTGAAATGSLPSAKPSGSAIAPARSEALGVSGSFFVSQLFKMQCRHPDWGGVNYCPPGTPPPPSGTFDPYQFTMQSLIGFIFHAQGYSELVTDCEGTPVTVTPASYAAGSAADGADPTRFVLDQFSTYTCRATDVSGGAAQTRVVSAVPDGSFQTTLHTRYEYDAGGGPQTDLFQVDVSMNGTTPGFLALNFASAEPFRSRLVLLVNLATHRFALKYLSPSQPSNLSTWAPARHAVAAGVGGYDLASGSANPGHYLIDFLDEPVPGGAAQACVNNVGGVFEDSFAPCSAEGVPVAWTTSDAIATYLAVPPAHAARLSPYLSYFETPAPLGPSDAWSDVGDEDLYWPASLR